LQQKRSFLQYQIITHNRIDLPPPLRAYTMTKKPKFRRSYKQLHAMPDIILFDILMLPVSNNGIM